MAEAADSDSDLDVDYSSDDYVRCPVCLDYYSDPKLLPCAHLICNRCLISWLKSNARPSTCPVCRGAITDEEVCRLPSTATPEEISKALPTDLSMEGLVDANRQLQGPHVCGKCGAEANSFCLDCYRKLCKKCRRKHTKVTNKKASKAAAKRETELAETAGAAAAAAAESWKGTGTNLPYVPPKKHRIEMLASLDQATVCSQRGLLCKVHTAEDHFVDYYCVDHETSLCLLCVDAGHKECSIVTMETKIQENRRELQKQADHLKRQEDLLRQEEANLMQKEQEAADMAEVTRAEIDNVMDGIQFRLREAQDKLKKDITESEDLPPEERAHQQTSLIRTFKDHLHEIMSLDGAEAALRRYEDYSRENIQAIHERTSALSGRRNGGGQRQRVHHHHRGHQQRGHHNHQHASPALSPANMSALRLAAADLSSAIQDVTTDLQQAVLSTADTSEDTPPGSQAENNPDTES